jgi:hypothetical protein
LNRLRPNSGISRLKFSALIYMGDSGYSPYASKKLHYTKMPHAAALFHYV